MKKGILKRKVMGLGEANELVWYEVFREPRLKEEFKTDFFLKLKNKNGVEVIIPFTDKLFRLVEI